MSATKASRCCFIAISLFACADASSAPVAREGRWWQQTTRDERLGYLAGYIACGSYEAGHTGLRFVSWYNLEPQVTEYYAKHPDRFREAIGAVLLRVASDTSRRQSRHVDTKGPHGIFDGEYWRQSYPEHRLGFIEGFLDCWTREKITGATFSHAPVWYVKQISTWFGIVDDDPGAIREDRADAKIADVLRQFRDK